MATLVLDPVTRLEGHLKVALDYDEGRCVTSARVSGQLFRGFEALLVGRPAPDAAFLTQRICGVCPVSHAVTASLALENAVGFRASRQARLLRNLIQGCDFVASHILHFYHLTAMDYVAGPPMSPWNPHPQIDVRLPDSVSKRIADNYVLALHVRRKVQEAGALFAGKLPHAASIVPGGVSFVPRAEDKTLFQSVLLETSHFVETAYGPDAHAIAEAHADGFLQGRGVTNLLAFGAFPMDDAGAPAFPAGVVVAGAVARFEPAEIREDVASAWYSSPSGLPPARGETLPDPRKPGAYTWMKAPRYRGLPFETGPLARMWLLGEYRNGLSLMDRHLARLAETRRLLRLMEEWLAAVEPGRPAYEPFDFSGASAGEGLTEAPRGALGHWARYESGKISRYQIISPTCWNASPRDDAGAPGPLEAALVGLRVSDVASPVEALRVIHSFDPCTACSVQ